MYSVEPRALVQAVKRNRERFPNDFMFQLSKKEFENLKSQFVISSWGGTARQALRLHRAGYRNVVQRAQEQASHTIGTNKELARRLAELEQKYDAQFKVVFDAIRELMTPSKTPVRRIGFQREGTK